MGVITSAGLEPPCPPASAIPWSPKTIIKGGKLFFQRSLVSKSSLFKIRYCCQNPIESVAILQFELK